MESWTADEKTSSRVVKSAERRCNSVKVRRKKIHPRQMLEKSRNAVFFQWIVCRVSRKVGLLKRRVRSHVVRGEIKNCTPLWRKAHFEVKMCKTCQLRSTFWSWAVEKMYAAVAKSTFGSENVKKLMIRDHFWKFRCWKIVRHCGEKHIRKWKCSKPDDPGPLFEVQMSKNCAPLWRKAHSEVKMLKNWGSGTTFWSSDVEKLCAAVAKSTFGSENVKKLRVRDHFLKFRCWKIVRHCGEKHIRKWKCSKPDDPGPLFEVQMSKNCAPLWRKAHSEVKMLKNWGSGTTFWSSDVQKLYAAVAKSTFGSENVKKLRVRDHFLKFRCSKIVRRCGEKHFRKWKC